MRTIKFRAWDGEEKRFLPIIEGHEYTFRMDDDGLYTEYESTPQKNVTLQMFTGLTDKNGKEIYEGDIVKFLYKNCIPEEIRTAEVNLHRIGDGGLYNNVCAYYPFVYTIAGSYKDEGRQTAECYLTPPSECEIIGNIYESPELLTNNK